MWNALANSPLLRRRDGGSGGGGSPASSPRLSRTAAMAPVGDTLETELCELLKRPVAKLPCCKDLPRLAPRIAIEHSTPSASTSSEDPPDASGISSMKRVLIEFARNLDGQEAVSRLETYFAHEEQRQDLEPVAKTAIFDVLGGDASATARLLKAVNQTVVASGVWAIRTRLPRVGGVGGGGEEATATKDCGLREGWRIAVCFARDAISVTHTRREVAAHPELVGGDWWFEWQLRLVLSRNCDVLQSCRVRVTALHFADTVDPVFRDSIDKALAHGKLIL